MKTCTKCLETWPLENFYHRKNQDGSYRYDLQCKPCRRTAFNKYRNSEHGKHLVQTYRQSEHAKAVLQRWYKNNKATINRHQRARQQRGSLWLAEFKLRMGCMDCGYRAHQEALDFDHRPGERKLFQIAQRKGRSEESLRTEIAKCDVVCANCHRVRTHTRRLAKDLF